MGAPPPPLQEGERSLEPGVQEEPTRPTRITLIPATPLLHPRTPTPHQTREGSGREGDQMSLSFQFTKFIYHATGLLCKETRDRRRNRKEA